MRKKRQGEAEELKRECVARKSGVRLKKEHLPGYAHVINSQLINSKCFILRQT